MTISVVKACQIVVRSMSMNKLYSEFAVVTRIKFPFFPWPNLIFYKPYVTSRNGPLMHNTTAYTSHIQNRNTWVIVDYHNELWENSKSSYTFVWATEKNVQELLSKSVHCCGAHRKCLYRNTVSKVNSTIATAFIQEHLCGCWLTHAGTMPIISRTCSHTC